MDRHEKDAVREGAFDFDIMQQERDCLEKRRARPSSAKVIFLFFSIAGADSAEHAVRMTHRLHVDPPEDLLPCTTRRSRRARCQHR